MRLAEGGLKKTLKHRTSVLKVLLGVGLGGGDAIERFIEDGDYALLLCT